MALIERRTIDWRKRAECVVGQLTTARTALEALSAALETGDRAAVQTVEPTAYTAVRGAAQSVRLMRAEGPLTTDTTIVNLTGSSLVLGGAEVASCALDVMLNAMIALAGPADDDDIDFLVSATISAESTYEIGMAVVEAAPQWDAAELMDVGSAFATEGRETMMKRMIQARSEVLAMKSRGPSPQPRPR